MIDKDRMANLQRQMVEVKDALRATIRDISTIDIVRIPNSTYQKIIKCAAKNQVDDIVEVMQDIYSEDYSVLEINKLRGYFKMRYPDVYEAVLEKMNDNMDVKYGEEWSK